MSKSYKFKNGNYIDSTGIVHNKTLLSELLKQMSKNPIGEFVLWEGNMLITNDNTFQWIGAYYNINAQLIEKYPVKTGFNRKYKLVLDYTDNKTEGAVYIRFTDFVGNNIEDKLFPFTWGDIYSDIRHFAILDAPDFTKYNTHINLYCTPDWASGRTSQNL